MNDKLIITLDELPTELDEGVFDSNLYGKSIKFERLTDSDRAVFDWGRQQLKHGFNRLHSDDPEILRGAALHMAAGAFIIGAQTHMSDSAKKFIDIERDGPKGRKGALTRRSNMQIWQDHVRKKGVELRRKNPASLA